MKPWQDSNQSGFHDFRSYEEFCIDGTHNPSIYQQKIRVHRWVMTTIPLLLRSETALPAIRWVCLVQNRTSMTVYKRCNAFLNIPWVIEGPSYEIGASFQWLMGSAWVPETKNKASQLLNWSKKSPSALLNGDNLPPFTECWDTPCSSPSTKSGHQQSYKNASVTCYIPRIGGSAYWVVAAPWRPVCSALA